MGKDKKEVRFNDDLDIKEFILKLEKNSDIYSIKRKVINIVDDEVENQTKLLTETQFLVKKTPHGKTSQYEISGFINKAGEHINDPKQIKEISKLYAHAEFADLQKNILGKFDKNGNLSITKDFEIDENLVFRKDGKLLFVKTQSGLINREEEMKAVNQVLQKGRFFFEDLGGKVNTKLGTENLNKKPTKPTLKRG